MDFYFLTQKIKENLFHLNNLCRRYLTNIGSCTHILTICDYLLCRGSTLHSVRHCILTLTMVSFNTVTDCMCDTYWHTS